MPSFARCELVDESSVGVYHCISRCVRRAFLCGQDPLTRKNFDHRKALVRRRLEQLAGIFGIDILGYTVMSNHVHLIIRNRPDVVKEWSDDEVARRWWNLFPKRRDRFGKPDAPRESELRETIANLSRIVELRKRLSSISWLMRCLCEWIARRANKEDGCKGRFWEGRFQSQMLLDESALLACATYVDLNPIRAGVAETPETSQYTSVFDRIQDRQQSEKSQKVFRRKRKRKHRSRRTQTGSRSGWLSPIWLDERPTSRTNRSKASRRASNKGFLPLKLDQYLEILDWTGRQLRSDKKSSIPSQLQPILARLCINSSNWTESVRNFGRWFSRAVGRAENLERQAQRLGCNWLHGSAKSKQVFQVST